MDKNVLKLDSYEIRQVIMNFDKTPNGKNKIQLKTSINVMVPDENKIDRYIIKIKVDYTNMNNETLFMVQINGESKFSSRLYKEKEDLLDEELKGKIIPSLYNKLKDFADNIVKLSNMHFMELPE